MTTVPYISAYVDPKTKPVARYSKKGRYLRSYKSVLKAGEDMRKQKLTDNPQSHANITNAIKKEAMAYGFQWRYINPITKEAIEPPEHHPNKQRRKP